MGAVWGTLLQQQSQLSLQPATWGYCRGVGGTEPTAKTPGCVHTSEGPRGTHPRHQGEYTTWRNLRPQAPREYAPRKALSVHP